MRKSNLLDGISRRSFLHKASIGAGTLGLSVIWPLENKTANGKNEPISWQSKGKEGVVAAGAKPSVRAGLDILEEGGNAADAAVSTILAQTITEYGDFCIGSELVFMFFDNRSKKVEVLSGQGAAPLSKKAIKWYMENGIPTNDLKAATVPGVIDLCVKALQRYGTLSFSRTVRPALKLLSDGDKDWYKDLYRTIKKLVQAEDDKTGNREEKLQAVSDRFYRGDIAASLDAWYKKNNAFLTKRDLAQHTTKIEKPESITYKGYTVYKTNSHTQGPVMLQALRLLEKFDLETMSYLSPKYIHTVVEALKLSFADRDIYYGDPLFTDVPMRELLSDEYTNLRYSLINSSKASNRFRPGNPVGMEALKENAGEYMPIQPGTTTCCVTDKWGNMVAATPSGWGSNADYGGDTGIKHGTRLRSFNTKEGHPNCIEAGKRPLITLTPTIVLKDNEPCMAISVEGGDVQDQTSLNIFLSIVEFGMTPHEAVTATRFATNLHHDSFNSSATRSQALPRAHSITIKDNGKCDAKCIEKLKKMGHHVTPSASPIGRPAIVYKDTKTNIFYGATDPDTQHFTGSNQDN